MSLNVKNRTIYCSDNLDILRGIDNDCIDLIYLDPPFNKNKKFTAPIGSSAEGAEFSDIFREEDVKDEWVATIAEDHDEIHSFLVGIKHIGNKYNYCYLCYMAIRLIEMHRVLRDTGGIYLHCDPAMSHYLKLMMDCIFGESNFRNEIIWWYYNIANVSRQSFGRKHDIIMYYSKTKQHIYNFDVMREPYTENSNWVKQGGYKNDKRYSPNPKGKLLHDVWRVSAINNMAKERTGYPTQKPLALLERIITASSKKGDVILDPFCGCATTCVAAEKSGRQWIGIDISIKAYELVQTRLKDEVYEMGLINGEGKDNTPMDLPTIHFFTDPPKRTDKDADSRDKKYVYVLSHKNYKNEYKVGIASNYKSRLNSYQTSDPDRSFRIEHTIHTEHYRELEKYIHNTFENKHEWISGNLPDIIDEIEKYTPKWVKA